VHAKGCQGRGTSGRIVRLQLNQNYPRFSMKINIEKINEIGKLLVEVVEAAVDQEERKRF